MPEQTRYSFCASCLLLLFFSSCTLSVKIDDPRARKGISSVSWGNADGKPVFLYTLTNSQGMQVKISNYGGTITAVLVPDKRDSLADIVLGFDRLSGYLAKPPYFGATIGRYGNRIARGKFRIGDTSYTLATNNGSNHLHGGLKGFDKVVWNASLVSDTVPELILDHLSPDGDQGYPGNLQVSVKFTLSDDNQFDIEYFASTDKPCPVNLTNHSYFNLSGDMSRDILSESLMIAADEYTPVDSSLIPTGEIRSVKGTPFDFTRPQKIGARIREVTGGYDHNFVLSKKDSSLKLAAILSDSASGRRLSIYTTEPGLQCYSGNFLDGTIRSSSGIPFGQHSGLCLETQHFPDSPNEPGFPSTLLRPGSRYHSLTSWKFSVLK
jgi:aldose 1-epimerase